MVDRPTCTRGEHATRGRGRATKSRREGVAGSLQLRQNVISVQGLEGDLANGRIAITDTFGPTYGDRLPAYHRLDARVTRSWATAHGQVSAFLDAYNLYDRSNPYGYEYSLSLRSTTLNVERTGVSMLPFLPSIGVSWAF